MSSGASRLDGGESAHDLVDGRVGEGTYLLVGTVLDGMWDEHTGRVTAQSGCLRLRGVMELRGGHEDARDAARLQSADVVHTARRAGPSVGQRFDHDLTAAADLVGQLGRQDLGKGRLAEARDAQAPRGQERDYAVKEDVAASLGDVQQAHGEPVQRGRAGGTLPARGGALGGRIKKLACALVFPPRVGGGRRVGPAPPPPMIAENRPAGPPAWTNHTPSGRNLGRLVPVSSSGMPSVHPPASRTSSSPGMVRSAWISSRSRAFVQPASRNTRACSGEMTTSASKARTSLGWAMVRRHQANERASDAGVRESWSITTRGPSPANNVTAEASAGRPRSTESGSQGEPSSSSAKQNVYLPGWPRVARSTSPGRPPPTLRTTSCSARPMVALARFPWPSALMPAFMPIARATGPLTITTGLAA